MTGQGIALAAAFVAIVVVSGSASQGYPPPFPRQGVTQILENDYVVAWHAQFPQNVQTAMHQHTRDAAAYFLTPGQVRSTFPDGTTALGKPLPSGHVLFNPKGTTHVEEWLIDGTRAIAMELKAVTASPARSDSGPGPVELDAGTYRTLLENEHVRMLEVTTHPGQTVATHSHPGRLIVQLAPCPGSRVPASAVTLSGGEQVWWAAPETHGGTAASLTQDCRTIETEVKAAR
jgi:quercetin dioxygenase-like cupin family protein